jgi:hypothetical protein
VPAVALAALLNLDWNRARPWLNAHTGEARGHPFAIHGNLALNRDKQAAMPAAPNEALARHQQSTESSESMGIGYVCCWLRVCKNEIAVCGHS